MTVQQQTAGTALELKGVRKNFGNTQIIRGLDLAVREGERHAIIGPNGAGKSTTFHLISGRIPVSAGSIRLHGQEITGLPPYRINRMGMSRSFQITNIFHNLSVYENLRCAVLWSQGHGYAFWKRLNALRDVGQRADQVLEQLGLQRRRDTLAGLLTYAEQRALEIGITIAGGAKVILLDEPTAGMSRHETERVVELIRQISEGRTLVMVEHDMSVVFGLADRISVLVYGEVIATDAPTAIRENPRVQEAYLGTAMEAEA
ncbi:ABC transporter ATP-binding protein [Verticiella sediminum]|uniref:ABC transporter ATP-binding protein n=1 Tax=Verticiella sediminum TaxID=1247510 RepID=A0A556ALZ6_9BURK|nr:ABC transporter ATP-binding protein [Verticiella sediminum]TSH93906.1 ABC transporter ATP-binding protein [Verticiella sediminum]